MSIEIDILNGNESWPLAKPLFDAVWPRDVLEKLPWGHVKWANADLRVLIEAPHEQPEGGLACHVGIYFRTVTWNGRKVDIGGIGGVATRADCRRRGYASIALNAAVQTMRDHEARSIRAPVLRAASFRHSISRAAGTGLLATSSPSNRTEKSASRPWRPMSSISGGARRCKAPSTYAACPGDPCMGRGGFALARSIVCQPSSNLRPRTRPHGDA